MGLITGYICLILALFLLVKYIARKLGLKKLNTFLMKIHKYVACAFLLVGLVHFLLVLNVLKTRSIVVIVSGIVAIIVSVALVIVCHTVKNRKVEIRFHRAFALIMTLMIFVHVISYFVDFGNYKKAINSIEIKEVDMSCIDDGEYEGSYDAGYIYAKVKVTVSNHEIVSVELLEHNNERGEKAEAIVDEMVRQDKIDVDAVSGASNSSNVIKQACINALTK